MDQGLNIRPDILNLIENSGSGLEIIGKEKDFLNRHGHPDQQLINGTSWEALVWQKIPSLQ